MILKTKLFILAFFIFTNCHSQENKILVTETTIKINALSSEELYFGFAEGDQIIINFELVKGKDIKEVEVFEYPNWVWLHSNVKY